MNEVTLWAVRFISEGTEEVAGKYITYDQAEREKQALEEQGLDAWITEEAWTLGPDGATQIRPGAELEAPWSRLIETLAHALSTLAPGQFLSLSTGDTYWVQFIAVQNGMRAEAVSDGYLPADCQLTAEQNEALRALGWSPPIDDDGIERAQNYYRDYAAPVPATDVAILAVQTLANVYGVPYPQNMTYLAIDKHTKEHLSFPDLGVAVYQPNDEAVGVLTDNPVADVQDLLLEAIESVDPDTPGWNDDGVLAIRFGSVPVLIRVRDSDPPVVHIWSPILGDVAESVHLLRELNDINTQADFARISLTSEGTIVVASELHGLPFVGKHLLSLVAMVGRLADSLDERLRTRHGGTPVFRPSETDGPAAPVGGYL